MRFAFSDLTTIEKVIVVFIPIYVICAIWYVNTRTNQAQITCEQKGGKWVAVSMRGTVNNYGCVRDGKVIPL